MANSIPFVYKFDFDYRSPQQITPLVRRVIAENPGAFTFRGTGTYIIGHGDSVAVIDPGPLQEDHIEALKRALEGENVTHILITHTHMDHSPAAEPLKHHWGAKTFAYGPHGAGKREQGVQVEEGGDMAFVPDVTLRHGDIVEGDGWTIEAVFTPGHTSNHLCFALLEEKALFTGDHIMGWSTSIISPPDGDMTAYMKSLELLLDRDDEIYWPTHGTSIDDPKPFVQAFIDHRLERERQILDCLRDGYTKIMDMVPVMYTDIDEKMYGAAGRSVLAAMVRLIDTGQARCDSDTPALGSSYSPAG